jgi:hypothetical protein
MVCYALSLGRPAGPDHRGQPAGDGQDEKRQPGDERSAGEGDKGDHKDWGFNVKGPEGWEGLAGAVEDLPPAESAVPGYHSCADGPCAHWGDY